MHREPSFKNTLVALPLIAGFHVLWIGLRIWQFRTEPLGDPIWLQVVWLLLYGGMWLLLTLCRHKWAANGYIALTVLNLLLRFTLKDDTLRNAFTDALFPIDLLCSFVLLALWRRLFPRRQAAGTKL